LKIAIAGKGGVGKTTLAALLAGELATRSRRVLLVDCDPNPNLAESLGLNSDELERFSHEDGLRRAGETVEFAREPKLLEPKPGLWLLGGPPTSTALADAVARGIAGVLLADRFDFVISDLGAGPEFTRIAVGGVLNPADICFVLSDRRRGSELAAERIEAACRARGVRHERVETRPGAHQGLAEIAAQLSVRLLPTPRKSAC
jgi:MinD-like ATPase involved in chromosome partitioning or flagellar assembly